MDLSIILMLSLFLSQVAGQSITISTSSRTANTEVAGPITVSPTRTTQTTDTTFDSHTANTIISGPTTISPTMTTQSTATTSDSHTANTIISGPTTVTGSETGVGQGHTANIAVFPTPGPAGIAGLALVAMGLGFGMAG